MKIKLSLLQRIKVLLTGNVTIKHKQDTQNNTDDANHSNNSINNQSVLSLLASLQKHGRLIDFIFEDIDAYSDDQVGAGVRLVHAGCKKVFDEQLVIQPIHQQTEESNVTVEEGFNPAEIKITGNTSNNPPYKGVLVHRGWRVQSINLPQYLTTEHANIITPAEVEIK